MGEMRTPRNEKRWHSVEVLKLGGYDAAFGGARRDEEKSEPRNVYILSGMAKKMR